MTRAQHIRAFITVVVVATAMVLVWRALRVPATVCFKTPESRARRDLRYLQSAIEGYRESNGIAPESLAALIQWMSSGEGFIVAEPEDLVDPWGHPLAYQRVEPDGYRVSSLGADGAPGGDGDDADIVLEGPGR